jgi:hypothetical protein
MLVFSLHNFFIHILCSEHFSFQYSAVCEVMWKCFRNGQATVDDIIRCVRCACWVNKATNTHSKYAILIAFPHQQWLNERFSMLPGQRNIARLVCSVIGRNTRRELDKNLNFIVESHADEVCCKFACYVKVNGIFSEGMTV